MSSSYNTTYYLIFRSIHSTFSIHYLGVAYHLGGVTFVSDGNFGGFLVFWFFSAAGAIFSKNDQNQWLLYQDIILMGLCDIFLSNIFIIMNKFKKWSKLLKILKNIFFSKIMRKICHEKFDFCRNFSKIRTQRQPLSSKMGFWSMLGTYFSTKIVILKYLIFPRRYHLIDTQPLGKS